MKADGPELVIATPAYVRLKPRRPYRASHGSTPAGAAITSSQRRWSKLERRVGQI
jgi:hypothetical protein